MIRAPRGTADVLGDEVARRETVEAQAKRILESAGFERIETPAFEYTELFARGVGEATDIVQKEMYTFEDGAGRSLTLRPEGTAPVCRAYVEHGMHKRPQPVKLWYLSSFFRAEAPQRGRYREFWQVGAETIGSDLPEADAELIVVLSDLLYALGVRGTRLRLTSLGRPETRAEYREELKDYLRAHQKQVSPEVRARIDLNPLRAFDADDPGTREVMQGAPRLFDRLSAEDLDHFSRVRSLLDESGVRYEIDTTLVRGLDYYTRTLFEVSSDALGAQSGVGGGGRYDRLIEQLEGPPTPAVGWAAGVERTMLAAGELPVPPRLIDLYVALATPEASPRAFSLARQARLAGLSAQLELSGRSLKGQLRQADRLRARYVAILGEGEETSLKELEGGEQRELPMTDVIPAILRGRRLA